MRRVINEEIERRASQTSMQFYLQTSSMIHELRTFSSNLSVDSEVINLLSNGEDKGMNRLEFCDYISSKISETRDIDRAYIISERNDRIYSNEGYYSYSSIESLLKRSGLVSQDYDFGRFGIDWNLYNESGYAPFCVIPVTGITGDYQNKHLGYIIATLDYRRFLDNFHTLDASVCAVYSDNFFISSVTDMEQRSNIDWNDQKQINAIVGEPVTCVYRSDQDYSYMVGISNSEYYQPLRILLIGFGIYFVVILITGLLILWRLLKRRRRESQQHLQERNLRYIVYGHTNRTVDEKFITDAGLPNDPDQSYVIALFFATVYRKHSSQDIEKTVLQYMQGTELSCTYFEDLNGPVFVFWSEDSPDQLQSQVIRLCHSVAQDFLNLQSMQINICTSEEVQGLTELENAFHKTSDMHEHADPEHRSKPVLSMNDIIIDKPDQNNSFMRSLQLLVNSLIAGKYDQTPETVRQLQTDYIDSVSDNIEFARTRRRTLANILANALMESNLGDEDKARVLNDFRHAMESEDLNRVTESYFGRVAALNTSDIKEASAYEEANAFIKENLHDHNLSVSMICDSLGMGVQKLTRIFHSNNDMAIAEYVNLLRVQEAQELLTSCKDLSVSEIADMVGYNNSHSLTRNFRKFTGLTPTEFRELE